jgi:hypothetical protein
MRSPAATLVPLRSSAAALVLLGALAAASPASAATGDLSLSAGVSWDQWMATQGRASQGFGSRLGFAAGLRDDWQFWAGASYAGFVGSGGRSTLTTASAGVAYLIDSLRWVPSLFAGVGYAGPPSQRTWTPDIALIAGGELEYRRFRDFGVSVRAEYRYLVLQRADTAGALSVALQAVCHF